MSKLPEPNLPSKQDAYSSQTLDVLGRDALNPATSWTPFWKPRFAAASSALVHLPFLFWLMENHAPKRVVQLGVDDGVAYLALCQAIDKLGLNASCRGISLPDAPEPNPDAIAQNDKFCEGFSIIATEKLATAHRHYRKGGIDLLVINIPLDTEAAAALAEKWNGLMSNRGLIVLLDSKARMAQEGADAWLNPLLDIYPAIDLDQGEGLLAISVGPDQNGRISRLAELELGVAGYREARQVFRTLGDGIVASHEIEELQSAREAQSTSLAEALAQLARSEEELTKTRTAEESAHEQLAQAQATSFDLETERAELEVKLTEAQAVAAELEKSEAARAALEAQLTEAQAVAAGLGAGLARAEKASGQAAKLASEQLEALRLEHAQMNVLAEQRLAESAALRAQAEQGRSELQEALSAAQNSYNADMAAKETELARSRMKYRERLADIAELGHLLSSKDAELSSKDGETARLQEQHEENELRSHVLAQLSKTKADLRQSLGSKSLLRSGRRASNLVAEDIRLVETSGYFDAEWYLAFYPDVAESGHDPAKHFVTEGAYELRNPGPGFDSLKYHKAYPDVTRERLAGFIHFVRHGVSENRQAFAVGERR